MVELEKTQDLEALRATAINLDRSIRSLLRENAKLRRENLELKGLRPQQLDLVLTVDEDEALSEPAPPAPAPKARPLAKRRETTGRTTQPKLQHRAVDTPLKQGTCPDCKQTVVAFESWDSSETVTVKRRVYEVVIERRQKGRCGCPDKVHTAPSTVLKMRSGGRYSVELTANVAVNKWCDHLPLERQSRRMARAGLEVTPQALFDQVAALGDELRPVYDWQLAELLASPVLGIDETSWKLLQASSPGSEYRAAIGLSTPTAAGYIFDTGKSTELMERHLAPFAGTLVCDGFAVYSAVAESRKAAGRADIELAHCWAHVLRRFREAATDFPLAEKMMKLIGELYSIDRRAGPFPGDGQVRKRRGKLRQRESTRVLKQIRQLALKLLDLPKDLSLRKAAAYVLSYWDGLKVFVHNPDVPLDNNGSERDLRQLVQGRKNHYGSGSQHGLDTAAVLYTLIQTCLKLGIDPEVYLTEAVRRRRANPTEAYLPRHALAESLES